MYRFQPLGTLLWQPGENKNLRCCKMLFNYAFNICHIMGRGGKRKGGKPREEYTPKEGAPYYDLKRIRDNEMFKYYYKNQSILPDKEFEEFYNTLKIVLPTTFRITGSRNVATELRERIKREFIPSLQSVVIDGESYSPPKPLPWYPHEFGWHTSASRALLKKSSEFARFHQFIVAETLLGNISRQEAVSMIPPLLLDVKPHHWVLDMCAAPGSKTAQIIEAIHANDRLNELPTGLVIANDADSNRSHMLVHQTKRLQSPCFIVTNNDASFLPNVFLTPEDSTIRPYALQYDRVLADVPCSGDGTFRKNEKIWKNWQTGPAMNLHSTQVQILLRGAQLLKPGGRIVYSTCSFNPIENEAVVAEALRSAGDALTLIDMSSALPGLKRYPGLTTWKVPLKEKAFAQKFEDVPESSRDRIVRSMFPPDNVQNMNLERCLRIYPHLQDTGGFFVAVLEKTGTITSIDRAFLAKQRGEAFMEVEGQESNQIQTTENENMAVLQDLDVPIKKVPEILGLGEDELSLGKIGEIDEDITEPSSIVPVKRTTSDAEARELPLKRGRYRKRMSELKEEPFMFLTKDNEDITAFSNFYGIDPSFPTDQFLVRSEEAKNRTVYFVSKSVKSVLQSPEVDKLRIVNTGIKAFVRQQARDVPPECSFRIHHEGLPLLAPYLSDKRTIKINAREFKVLLVSEYPKFEEFELPIQNKLRDIEMGCCVFHLDSSKDTDLHSINLSEMFFPVWRAKVSLNLLLNKEERRSVYMQIFGEKSPDSDAGIEIIVANDNIANR